MQVGRSPLATPLVPVPVLELGQRVSNGGDVRPPHEMEGIIQFEGGKGCRAHGFVFCRQQILQQQGGKKAEKLCVYVWWFKPDEFFRLTHTS